MKKYTAKCCGVKFPFSMILVKFNYFACETHRYLSESVKADTNMFHNRAIFSMQELYLVKTVTAIKLKFIQL